MTVRYDASNGPSGGPTRGAIALRDHWREVTGLGDMGIYNPRRIRGSRAWSIHASGRAVDFAANAAIRDQREKADRYCEFLIRHSEAFLVQYLIWNRRSWKSGRGWRNYTGVSPHTDHIHVELNETGGQNLTLSKLRTQWARDTVPEEEPIVPELEIVRAFGEWLGRPPSDSELALHTWNASVVGVPKAVLGIARSEEAAARRTKGG